MCLRVCFVWMYVRMYAHTSIHIYMKYIHTYIVKKLLPPFPNAYTSLREGQAHAQPYNPRTQSI